MDFLQENSVAGQTLLRLVSRGNAIIAELLRLSDHVPSVFYLETKEEQRTVGQILFDFRYLKQSDAMEAMIESTQELIDLDEEFRVTHLPLLQRFYQLFESIYKYGIDFRRFLEDLQEGVFIQMTLESVLADEDGKQLMAEALYLLGVQLKLLDVRIEGVIRERLLISFYRYKGHQEITNMDEVCQLCRATGFSSMAQRKPANYPEDYFSRISLPREIIQMIIGRLRSDDIYGQIRAYPLPDHRSAALASQSAMLYIILYFAPEVLHKEQASMREMVDKHFPDNWVLSYYMGFTVDLSVAWDGYKAARLALSNTIAIGNVKHVQQRHIDKTAKCQKELKHLLTEGVLTEEYVLDNIQRLLNILRECNVTIRWLMLHATARVKKLRDVIIPEYNANEVLQLLLDTAQFEFLLKVMFNRLLDQKQERWDECKKEASERMVELGAYFGGESALTRGVQKDEQLMGWFKDIASKIEALDYEDSTSAGRKIQQLVVALDKVEEFHQMEGLQVKQFLGDTRDFLFSMLRAVNVKEDVIVTLSLISDFGYAWQIINDYVPLMQDLIRNRPTTVIKLRSTFLKLASILDAPLIRINQCASPDLESVAEYYSGELVAFVRKVLEIIPKSMFGILRDIVQIQTYKLKEIPARVEKSALREFSQLEDRLALSRATHAVSVFTEGILAMETTLVGIIKVDPKQLLEDGIRKELVWQIADALDKILVFRKGGTIAELEDRLKRLDDQLDGFRKSFEYISDYVNIYGLKIWQEEFTRISLFSVQQECNRFLKKKVYEWQSEYFNPAIPIPIFAPQDDLSANFVGRLARELLNLTAASKCTYSFPLGAWLDANGKEVVGIRTLSLLHRSIGTAGLFGLDRLFSFIIVSNLQRFNRLVQRGIDKQLVEFMRQFEVLLDPVASVPQNAHKLYSGALTRLSKMPPELVEVIMAVGQAQLLRRMIQNELNFSAKLHSNILTNTLTVFNRGVMAAVHAHYRDPENVPFPGGADVSSAGAGGRDGAGAVGEGEADGEGAGAGAGNGGGGGDADEEEEEKGAPLLFALAKYLDIAGMDAPLSKIYVTQKPFDSFVILMFLLTLMQLPKLGYNATFQTLSAIKKGDSVDGMPLCAGILTILKQFHSRSTHAWLSYIGQYARGYINSASQRDARSTDLPSEVIAALHLLDDFCRAGGVPRKVVEGYVPGFVFDSKGSQ